MIGVCEGASGTEPNAGTLTRCAQKLQNLVMEIPMKTTTVSLILAATLSLAGGLAFADGHHKMQAMADAGM